MFGLFACVFSLGYSSIPKSAWSLSCDHGFDYASKCDNNNNNMEYGCEGHFVPVGPAYVV